MRENAIIHKWDKIAVPRLVHDLWSLSALRATCGQFVFRGGADVRKCELWATE